jgi:RHS repeat-associated protein
MNRVTGPGLPAYGAVYGYMMNGPNAAADLVTTVDFRSGESTTVAGTTRVYETHRNLIASVQNQWPAATPPTVSNYAYTNDILARRTSVVYTGSAFAQDHLFKWGYNGRNELTGANQHAGNDPANPGAQFTQYGDFDYAHDNIGNRITSAVDSAGTTYTSNDLNQYMAITPPQPPATLDYDDDGNMTMDDRGMVYAYDTENRLTAVAKLSPGAGDKKVVYGYDYQGRRIRTQVFAWNTGSAAWSTSPESDVRFVYDGWRVIMELDGLNADAVTRKYTWGLDLAGLNGSTSRDRQGAALDAAGGIGGLLAAYDTAGTTSTADDRTFLYTYDANGNVGQLIEPTGGTTYALAAKYEYDPYGQRINTPAQGEYDQPYRFSTKPFDPITGNGDWDYRWYDPRLGRFINRDPLDEAGATLTRQAGTPPSSFMPRQAEAPLPFNADVSSGMAVGNATYSAYSLSYVGSLPARPTKLLHEQEELNLYEYARQSPTNHVDPLGLSTKCGTRSCICCQTGTRQVNVYGDSARAKAIIEAGFGKGASGCVTLLNWFGTGAEIYCTMSCNEIKSTYSYPRVRILDHECCHACDYFDKGVGEYLGGAIHDTCNSRPSRGPQTW